ncbi:hypothetical protein GCM10009665_50160 [Kitasatospora nipponensis]|uniref:Uncharacterized protein n=1 Tax=Kitasatospora nipponensis TaxID=258049 RepID=A0ABP4HA64_9ACTN
MRLGANQHPRAGKKESIGRYREEIQHVKEPGGPSGQLTDDQTPHGKSRPAHPNPDTRDADIKDL